MENTYSGVVKAELRLLTFSVNRWMGGFLHSMLLISNTMGVMVSQVQRTQAGQEINGNANT